jgi:hypothetical protein
LLGYLALGVEEGENDAQKKSLAKNGVADFRAVLRPILRINSIARRAASRARSIHLEAGLPNELLEWPFARRRLAFYLFPKLLARHIADLSNDRYCLRVS